MWTLVHSRCLLYLMALLLYIVTIQTFSLVQRCAEIEQKENEAEEKRLRGTTVYYGARIQARTEQHIAEELY